MTHLRKNQIKDPTVPTEQSNRRLTGYIIYIFVYNLRAERSRELPPVLHIDSLNLSSSIAPFFLSVADFAGVFSTF